MAAVEGSFDFSVWKRGDIEVLIPLNPLRKGSLEIITVSGKKLSDWTKDEHVASLECMQKIARVWKKQGIEQHFIFGKTEGEKHFSWQMVPYVRPEPILFSSFLGRIWQQLAVLWNITFGAPHLTDAERCDMAAAARGAFSEDVAPVVELVPESIKGSDAFCRDEVIEKQWVVKGKEVTLLYNYAPIGFGGERLHFLTVPNRHTTRVVDFTETEYAEAMELEQKAIQKLKATRAVTAVYRHTAAGSDAGQAVDHGLFHSILVTNCAQDFFGKCTVLWKMLFGSSPMKAEELAHKVAELRIELNP